VDVDTDEQMNKLDGVAIIGVSGRFPGASSLDEFWQNLREGVESVTSFTDTELLSAGEDPALLNFSNYVKAGIVLDGVDLFDADLFGFTPREAEITNPEHRIFLECAWEALENAGYDPQRYAGKIGVFAGAGMRCSYRNILMSSPRLAALLGDLPRFIAVDKDFLTTSVSYRLNLKGPSIAVQTACSTSLVAVHLGCQSLLNGDSDMVLAGGVSVRIPQIAGYVYQEGSIYSPDGHCRAFDAKANGTIFGSGAGIVVLKRLTDALSDGDCIRAVIRSSSINNDGAVKIGYTAPSVDGQAAVIAEAHAMAGVAGDEITYVETHGTGTPLGDPIEVAALTKAFRRTTPERGFCAIGSLKTNIGHLDAAAGVAGLIKVVLALENRMLPPSLNFTQANPTIDFANSPFYVQQTLSGWQPASGLRVAGVSSFGIGGTNAHVIVEEAPSAVTSDESHSWQLLPISGKTPGALQSATNSLAKFLAGHNDYNLADVAFTLQEGRKILPYRRIVAADSIENAVKRLRSGDSKRVVSGTAFEGDATVAFMFPAQGAQYANMGRDLYEAEPVFREQIDRCVEHLRPMLGLDLRKLLFPQDNDLDEASEQLRQTRFTQPAVFMVDYALAQLWMSWGIMPATMVGHSLGEYVAATLSGVFDLEDALTLVADRGRLMQELPPGSMLAVHLSEDELQPWLREDVSLAAVNAPQLSVVSGPVESIERLADAFRAEQIDVQPLRTSHAFHSSMIEPIVAPLVERVSRVPRHPPNIPFISTLTGTWIAADEATDPAYWGRQARYGVRFGPSVAELLKTPGRVLLEVGPGTTLSSLAKLQKKTETPYTSVNSLRHVQESRPDHDCMLTALGTLWMAGIAVDWERLHADEGRRRVQLPSYPFQRKRFWIDTERAIPARPAGFSKNADSGSTSASEPSDKIAYGDSRESDPSSHAEGSLHSRPDLPNEYVAPRTDLEERLAALWQDFLGIDKIGTHDSFFDLGGTSLIATQLFAEIQRRFGVKLPLRIIVEAPTVRQLAGYLGRQSESGSEALVELRRGGPRNFFLVHDGLGETLLYLNLARRLPDDLAVFGIEPRRLAGVPLAHTTIEEMAAFYIEQARKKQPQGPYLVGGMCAGGVIAYEMASQLLRAGEDVELVALLDAPRPRAAKRPWLMTTQRVGRLKQSFADARDTGLGPWRRAGVIARTMSHRMLNAALWEITDRGQRWSVRARFRLLRVLLRRDRAWPKFVPALSAQEICSCAQACYVPKPLLSSSVVLVRPQTGSGDDTPYREIYADEAFGWATVATHLAVVDVEGGHSTMLQEQYVDSLAAVLRPYLQQKLASIPGQMFKADTALAQSPEASYGLLNGKGS
jgi:phthiocerol/phenolphthiocerol synthesis type-I polyketide synthase E